MTSFMMDGARFGKRLVLLSEQLTGKVCQVVTLHSTAVFSKAKEPPHSSTPESQQKSKKRHRTVMSPETAAAAAEITHCAKCGELPEVGNIFLMKCADSLCELCFVKVLNCACISPEQVAACTCSGACPGCNVPISRAEVQLIKTRWQASEKYHRRFLLRACACGASQNPSFGLPGTQRKDAKWCPQCPTKPAEAVDMMYKTCVCGQGQPRYGMPGEPRNAGA
jgi:hypothetical protein